MLAQAQTAGMIKWGARHCSPSDPTVAVDYVAFAASVNVTGYTSLAGIGYDDTVVQVIAGNLPPPANPLASYIAVLSAIATLGGCLTEHAGEGTCGWINPNPGKIYP